ncbi:MAG: hypothetical protein LBC35_04755 [Coriobacteriales bacterium]|jgi:hypothetical protein|nr:hypothetical protein [Coriobacteriales bacterium]
MKKVLVLASVLVAVVLFALFYQFRPIGQLDFNAYVLEDNTVPQNLNSQTAADDAQQVDASRFDIFSPLYELAGDLFIGEGKSKPNPALPIFANDGSALMLINSQAKLIDTDFNRLDTFRGQFVSNGAAYNPDRSRSDPNTITLVALSGGLYANAMDMTAGDTDVAMNSVIRFSKDVIAYYEMSNGSFFYNRITNLDENSTIRIGSLDMNYHEFLRKLGILRDAPSQPTPDAPPVEAAREPVANDVMPAISNNPYEAPQVSLSSMRSFAVEGFARGRLHVSDSSAAINSDIVVYINGITHDYTNIFTLPWAQFSGRQTLSVDVDFFGLIIGSVYEVYGEYTYTDVEGNQQYVRFGDQTFRFEPSDRPTKVQEYVKPTVTCDPFDSTTYFITSTQQVKDPASRVIGGVRYDIIRLNPDGDPLTNDAQLYARKYVGGSGAFRLGPLPPSEDYHVRAYFIYRDAYNEEITEELFEQDISTKGLDLLTPIKLNFINGQLYSNKVSLDDVYFDTTVSPDTLEIVSRVDLQTNAVSPNAGSTNTRLAGTIVSALKNGEPHTLQTANNLNPNTTYDYSFSAADPFGNPLPIAPPTTGQTHTCKALPSATIKTTTNVVGHAAFNVSVADIHTALAQPSGNVAFMLYDLEGNLVDWYSYPFVRATSTTVNSSPLDNSGGAVDIAGLRLSTTYRITIVADYNIADGRGMQQSMVIGSSVFTTPSVLTLGSLVLDSKIQDGYPTDSAVKIDTFANRVLTNPTLLDLLEVVAFNIYRADDPDTTVQRSAVFQREDQNDANSAAMFAKLLAGDLNDPALLEYLYLPSMTEYVLDTHAQIRVIDDYYEVRVSNTVTGFKTLRKTPVGVISWGSLIGFTDSIYIFGTYVDDPDGSVVNGRVTMKVTDVGVIQLDGSVTGGTNAVVALEPLIARTSENNEPGKDFVLRGLQTGHRYKVEYLAAEYNNGYDFTSYRTNIALDTFGDWRSTEPNRNEIDDRCYYVDTTDSLSGRLSLVGMDSIANDPDYLLTSIKTEITDLAPQKLVPNPAYTLKFFKRPGYGDYYPDTDNFSGGSLTVGLSPIALQYADTQSRPLSYYFEYRVELWVNVAGNAILLDQLEFDTDGPMILIGPNYANAKRSDGSPNYANDLRMLETPQPWGPGGSLIGGPEARYLVIEDLIYDNNYNYNYSGDGRSFEGTIDFQGHSFQYTKDTSTGGLNSGLRDLWIHNIGARGILRNIVFNLDLTGNNPREAFGLVRNNSGLISNIMVNVTSWNQCYNWNTSLICYNNLTTGVIDSFVINLEDDISVRDGFGAATRYNDGVVRNGYIYSQNNSKIKVPVILNAEAETFSTNYIGGLVGINRSTGRINSVFSLVDVDIAITKDGATNRSINQATIGAIVGYNDNGQISDSYAASTVVGTTQRGGQVSFDNSKNTAYGPGVGGQSASARTLAYYSNETNYTNSYNAPVGIESLRDYLWQANVLGSAFATEKQVVGGFYPQLNWPYSMPNQPYLALPGLTSSSTIALSSIMIEEQFETYAIALATFKNPNFYTITGLTTSGLSAVQADYTQTDIINEGITYKRFRLDNPTVFKSSYPVVNFRYRSLNSLNDYTVNVISSVNAEFYKPVVTPQDWKAINNDLSQNYRLKNDIDLRELGLGEIRLGDTSQAKQFAGHLDGGYYNADYELQGFYQITLPAFNNVSNGQGAVIPRLAGRVTNMQVDGLHISAPSEANAGFVRLSVAGGIMDNVHFSNAYLKGSQYMGAAIAQMQYSNIMNCSVNTIQIEDSSMNFAGGGLVGLLEAGSSVYNSYAYGVDIKLTTSNNGQGAGGLIGRFTSGEVQNVYAQGKISSTQNFYIGGIVGFMSGALTLQHFWADVEIFSDANGVGEVIGSAGATTASSHVPFYGIAVGNVASSQQYNNVDPDRPVRRFNGFRGGTDATSTNSRFPMAFSWDQQKVNGKLYNPADTTGNIALNDGTALFSTDDLKQRQTWMMQIHMGDEFEYEPVESMGASGVSNGYLPLLYSTHGGLLPYQTPVELDTPAYSIDVGEAGLVGSLYQIDIIVKHPAGVRSTLQGVRVEYTTVFPGKLGTSFASYFQVGPSSVVSDEESLIIFTFNPDEDLERYLDSYRISSLVLQDGTEVPVDGQIVFRPEEVPYRPISNIQQWLNLMKPETNGGHGDTLENFRIVGDIDFTGLSASTPTLMYDLKINRLMGGSNAADTDGLYTFKNLDLTFSQAGHSFIKQVSGSLGNLRLQNITIRQTPTGGNYVGFVGVLQGNASYLSLDNVRIEGNSANYVAPIGFLKGNVAHVQMQRIYVKTTGQHVGGLVGYALDATFEDVHIKLPANTYPSDWPGQDDTQDNDLTGLVDATHTANPNYVTGTYMVGGIVGRAERGTLAHCSAEYTTVYTPASGSQNYTGILCGYSIYQIVNANIGNNYHLQVTNSVAYGQQNVGGIFGYAYHSTNLSQNDADVTRVDKVTVIAKNRYAGGIAGSGSTYWRHCETRNSLIFGTYDIGGIAGAMGSGGYYLFTRDTTVSTVYDDLYVQLTGMQDKVITVPAGRNTFIGGIAGRARMMFAGVVNSDVGGIGATEVGGILGRQENYSTYGNYVLNTNVWGKDQIGGIVGRHTLESESYNVTNATVVGTGQYVGGIVGYMVSSQPLYGTRAGSVTQNMFAGSVTGAANVAGIVGYVQGELYPFITGDKRGNNVQNSRNHMLGTVVATGTGRADLIINLDLAYSSGSDVIRPYFTRILGSATLTRNGVVQTAEQLAASDPITYPYKKAKYYDGPTDVGSTDPGSTSYRVPFDVNSPAIDSYLGYNTELSQTLLYNTNHYKLSYDRADGSTNYTAQRLYWVYRLGGNATNSYYGNLGNYIYGPLGTFANGSAASPFSAGYLPYASSYAGLAGSLVQSFYSEGDDGAGTYYSTTDGVYSGGIAIPQTQTLGPLGLSLLSVAGDADLDAYAVGADKLNVEFPRITPNTEFAILSGDTVLFNSVLEHRTYTFTYDFATPLTVLVNTSGVTTSFEVDPVPMRRSVMVFDDDILHITASGVQSSTHGLLPGTYLHVQKGEALAEGGVVFTLASGSIARHVGEFKLADNSPLPLVDSSFDGTRIQTFKNYSVVADGTVRPMRIFAADGSLFSVDPELPVVFDGIVVGAHDGSTYMTVLDADGTVVDTQDALVYPENFDRSGIAEMSNNLSTNQTVMMVRYVTGKVVAFDYLTGTTIELIDAAGNESFADYASRFFRDKVVSKLAGLATGYQRLSLFKEAVEQGKLSEGIIGPNLGSAISPDSGAAAHDLPVVGGDVLEKTEGATGGGSATGGGDASGGPEGGGGTGGSDRGSTSVEEPAGGPGGGLARTGDLAKPPAGAKTVALFNYATGLYELYDQNKLLGGDEAGPLAVMDSDSIDTLNQIRAGESAAGNASSDILSSAIKSGIPILASVLVAIGALLVLLFVRRTRLSKK